MPQGVNKTPRNIEKRIVKLYKKGYPLRAVGLRTGVSRQTALRVLRDYGIPRRGKGGSRRPIPADLQRQVVAFCRGFRPLREAEKHFHMGRDVIVRILDAHHVDRRTAAHRHVPERIKLKIIADYKAGLTINQAAHKHGGRSRSGFIGRLADDELIPILPAQLGRAL